MPSFKIHPLCAALILGSLATTNVAIAQEEALTLEEIIVTARNKEESLQEIPVAINVFSSKDIERQDIQNMRDVVRSSPGVAYNSAGSVSTGNITIRGMSQPGLVGDDTNVAIFVDGVYMSGRNAAFVPMMGLERVEVVRGPQSAIYGRNAFSGAMNYITKKPTDETEVKIEANAGDYGRKGFKGRVSGGLSNTVAASIDFTKDLSGSTFKDKGKRLGSIENNSQRARIVITPSDALEIDLGYTRIDMQEEPQAGFEMDHNGEAKYQLNYAKAGGPGWENPEQGYIGEVTAQPIDGAVAQAEGSDAKSDKYNMTVNFDINDELTLTSITAYGETESRALTGYDVAHDSTASILAYGAPGGAVPDSVSSTLGLTYAFPLDPINGIHAFWGPDGPGTGFTVQTPSPIPSVPGVLYSAPVNYKGLGGQPNEDRVNFSQEFRLSSDGKSALSWSGGLMYAKDTLDQWLVNGITEPGDTLSLNALAFATNDATNGVAPNVDQTNYETEIQSAFFSLGYDISNKLIVSAEGRYTKEKRKFDNTINDLYPGALKSGKGEGTWSWFSPRVTLTYLPDDYTTLYANVAKGTKAGGINSGDDLMLGQPGYLAPEDRKYDPETNTTFEIGAKRTVLDGRGYMNIAAYIVDWKDQQINNFASGSTAGQVPSTITSNLGKSEIKGVEIETAFQIANSWSFHAGYTFNDAKIKEGVMASKAGYTDYEALGMNPVSICDITGAGSPFNPLAPDCSVLVSDGDVSGNQLPGSVRNTVNLGVRYTRDLDFGAQFYTNMDYVWKDKKFMDPTNAQWVDSYDSVNLNMGIEADHWYGKISVSNLLEADTPVTSYTPYIWTGAPQASAVNRNGRMTNLTVGYQF